MANSVSLRLLKSLTFVTLVLEPPPTPCHSLCAQPSLYLGQTSNLSLQLHPELENALRTQEAQLLSSPLRGFPCSRILVLEFPLLLKLLSALKR